MNKICDISFFYKLFFSAFFLLPFGLWSSEIALTKEDAGKTISLHTGDTISLSLQGNITTGYSWEVVKPLPSCVKFIERKYASIKKDVGAAGAPGIFTFTFLAAAPGSSVLTLVYLRPWEKEKAPSDTFNVTLVIE